MQIFQINRVNIKFNQSLSKSNGQGDQYPLTLFIKLIVKNDSLMRFPLSCMKFMEPKIGQKSALISVCTLFDCKMYLFKSKLRQFPHWLNVGKSKQKNWRAYWSWLLLVSFTGLNFRFTKHIRLKMILGFCLLSFCQNERTQLCHRHVNTLGHLSCKQMV